MADGRVMEWEQLTCPQCSGRTFLAVVHLRAKYGSGTTTEYAGWQCSGCGGRADVLEMQRVAHLKQRKAELEALEAEIGQQEAQTPSVRTSGFSGNKSTT